MSPNPIDMQDISLQQIFNSLPTPFNLIAGSGGNGVGIAAGGDATSGGYINPVTGESGGYTSTSCGSQSGLGVMGGGFAGIIFGDASNIGGLFNNLSLAIPGLNFSVTAYRDSNGDVIGGSLGYGPGIGFTSTNTNTTLYPH